MANEGVPIVKVIPVANSGVDIGDVDVTSIAPGETHLGAVGGHVAVVSPAVVVTAGAYHANDNVGGKLTLAGAARVSGGGTTLTRVTVTDAANQKAQLEIVFFSASPADSTFTDNAACVIHANDEAKVVGRLTIYASDYLTVGAKAVACLANIGLAMIPATAALYAAILTPGTPTYAATSDLRVSFAFYQE